MGSMGIPGMWNSMWKEQREETMRHFQGTVSMAKEWAMRPEASEASEVWITEGPLAMLKDFKLYAKCDGKSVKAV